MWHARFQFPNQGLNPCPLHWEPGVVTTGPPRKSLPLHFKLQPCSVAHKTFPHTPCPSMSMYSCLRYSLCNEHPFPALMHLENSHTLFKTLLSHPLSKIFKASSDRIHISLLLSFLSLQTTAFGFMYSKALHLCINAYLFF